MKQHPSRYGASWARDELILAFELYCRTPFSRTKANNPEVRTLAVLLDRSPAAVARKLGNFGAFDPELRERGVSGLGHGSRQDRKVWDEFHRDWGALVLEAHEIRKRLGEPLPLQPEISLPRGTSERLAIVKQRLHQWFFREAVLSSYQARCCITGITVTECLVASHIVPWSVDERYRTDPSNGLCLSATFDRLFDTGLMTITPKLTVEVSSRLRRSKDQPVQELICACDSQPIFRPHRFLPSVKHLEWHRRNVFIR